MIGQKLGRSQLPPVVFFAPTNPSQKHFFSPLSVGSSFWGLAFLACVRHYTLVPFQLGADSSRPLCPAPVPPCCHLSNRNISLFFLSPMEAFPPPPAESPGLTRFGRSGNLFFLVWSPPNLHACLRLSVLHAPPPCPLFANVPHFFFCYPAPTVPLLGSFGRFHSPF